MSRELEVNLYKTKLAFQRTLPWTRRYLMEEKVSIDSQQEFVRDLLIAQLTGYLYGEPGETQTISHPSDWHSNNDGFQNGCYNATRRVSRRTK